MREDRRHITDEDIDRLMAQIDLPLNLEMAATEEMLAIALAHRPHAACIVPEKREERTTEGGLDAAGQHNHLAYFVNRLGVRALDVLPQPRGAPRTGTHGRRTGLDKRPAPHAPPHHLGELRRAVLAVQSQRHVRREGLPTEHRQNRRHKGLRAPARAR